MTYNVFGGTLNLAC